MKQSIVIINGSGKCGTMSLFSSFNALTLAQHSHSLTKRKGQGHLKGKIVLNFIKKCNMNVIIVDAYRDIIDRKIASFFENIHIKLGMKPGQIKRKYNNQGIGFIQKKFSELLIKIENYVSSARWKDNLNYNFLQKPFNHEKHAQVFRRGKYWFVNLRFKDIANWNSIIPSLDIPIPNLQTFKLHKTNIGNQKWYRNIYKEFKQKFTMTRHQFNTIFKNHHKYMEHFWTPEEIVAFEEKWENKIVN